MTDQLQSLIKLAGERDQPSNEAVERARAAAQASWREALARAAASSHPRRPRWLWTVAASVGAAAILMAGLWMRDSTRPAPLVVARVAAASGQVTLAASGHPVVAGAALSDVDAVVTGEGRAALSLGALSLRLDRQTRVELRGEDRVQLLQGRLYVDSGGLNAGAQLDITTPAGVLTHVGTQYQVHVAGEQTRVQVREGRVVLARIDQPPVNLGAGEGAYVAGSLVERYDGLLSFGQDWDWAAETAPAFDIENRPLSEFLGWFAREHGWQLRFADGALQARATDIRLHGSLAGLDAEGSLAYVSAITGVPLGARDGVLLAGGAP